MIPVPLHVACLGLLLANYTARAVRIRILLGGAGCRITMLDAVRLNAWGDAACVITPMRIGGEPTRVWGMVRAGVPTSAAIVALALETVMAWPVIITFAVVIGVLYGARWGAEAVPSLAAAAYEGWPWAVALVLLTLAAWIGARRLLRHPRFHRLHRGARRARVYVRRTPWSVLLLTLPLTLVDLVSRVLILVVLSQALPAPPPVGPTMVGSFILLYAQLLLPTPSGAGVVDLGFLHGATGATSAGQTTLLLWWRFYTNAVGFIVGLGFLLFASRRTGEDLRRELQLMRDEAV